MRSRRYHLASTSAMNFSQNSTAFTQKLIELIRMSLSVSGELPPGQYYVTVEYRNFVGQSQVPPYWQEKSASQPSTQAIFSKEDMKQDTSPILDLQKARRESEYPEIRRPQRTIFTEPLLPDLDRFYDEHIANARRLAVDIETRGQVITCIGFAPTIDVALVLPFEDHRNASGRYWGSKRPRSRRGNG